MLFRLNDVVAALRASKEAVEHLREACGADRGTYALALKNSQRSLQTALDAVKAAQGIDLEDA